MDRYTKTVLTVIAAALCAIVVQNAVQPSHAQQGAQDVQRVAICDVTGMRCAAVEAGLGRVGETGGSLRILGDVRSMGR